jgi:hypothetical protein
MPVQPQRRPGHGHAPAAAVRVMARGGRFSQRVRPGFACVLSPFTPRPGDELPAGGCSGVADLYGIPFADLIMSCQFHDRDAVVVCDDCFPI